MYIILSIVIEVAYPNLLNGMFHLATYIMQGVGNTLFIQNTVE